MLHLTDLLRFKPEGVFPPGGRASGQRVARVVLDGPPIAGRRHVDEVAAAAQEGIICGIREQPPRRVVDLILQERLRSTTVIGEIVRVARERSAVDQPEIGRASCRERV